MAGALILLVMRMLAEMSTAFPGVGSFTEYARLGLGHWAGFTSGWLYWYFWAIVVAIETVAGLGTHRAMAAAAALDHRRESARAHDHNQHGVDPFVR